jgi:hypothetical protein
MFQRFLTAVVGVLVAAGVAGSATASVVGSPAIVDPEALVLWTAPNVILINSDDLMLISDLSPSPELDFLIFAGAAGGVAELVVQNAAGQALLTAVTSNLMVNSDGISAVLRTTLDEMGLFGSRLSLTVGIETFDPNAPYSGPGNLTIVSAVQVIPLPATLPLLAAGLTLFGLVRRRT